MRLIFSPKYWKDGDESPYSEFDDEEKLIRQAFEEERDSLCPNLDLDLLADCLLYHRQTKTPLPERLINGLLLEIDFAMSGRETRIFNKPAGITKPKTHPILEYLQKLAVAYAINAKEYELDEKYVMKVARICDVDESTIHAWKRKYPSNEIPLLGSLDDAEVILTMLRQEYSNYKDL